MNGWSWFWIAWAGTSLSVFLFGELYAIAGGRPYDKLSQNFWRLQDTLPAPTVWRFLLFLGLLFLAFHLTFGPRH